MKERGGWGVEEKSEEGNSPQQNIVFHAPCLTSFIKVSIEWASGHEQEGKKWRECNQCEEGRGGAWRREALSGNWMGKRMLRVEMRA